ncbi:synaptonemal complex protein 1-like [Clytia hemisphaerica]|uniref:synaptonemal complex protein 1-like n=1 Tax=Clytia hemisphaerica TaxID=252671 RepID=UPI0034D60CE0
MDNAHSAEDRQVKPNSATGKLNEIQKLKAENAKLKEDYEKQIKTLKLENKIVVLELKKENQNLKHEMELMQIRFQLEKESKSDGNLTELKKQILEIENEYKTKLEKKDQEMIRREAEHQKKIKTLEDEYQSEVKSLEDQCGSKMKSLEKKLQDAEQRNELNQAIIQKLQSEIVSLKTRGSDESRNSSENQVEKENIAAERVKMSGDATEERLRLGIERFYLRKTSSLTQNYQVWYNDVSCSLENQAPRYVSFDGKEFMFLKIEFGYQFSEIEILTLRKEITDVDDNLDLKKDIICLTCVNGQEVENMNLKKDTEIMLLHPKEFSKCLNLIKHNNRNNQNRKWTERIWYDGYNKTAIILCVL